jgi:hypothetical protein
MSLLNKAWNWNATDEEWWASYPCDRHIEDPYREMMRAVDVQASVEVAYRWVCQLQVAPYSYDWLDNFGRSSPRELTPGSERLEVGGRFGIGPILEFEQDNHVTVGIYGRLAWLFGPLSVTYLVTPTGPASSRLVVKLNVGCRGWWGRVRALVLAWGDLVMMRKQLLTLKTLAENNNLPVLAAGIFPGELEQVPGDVLLRLTQTDVICASRPRQR